MASDVRKIDPSLSLGLHELAATGEGRGSFRFQLQFAKQQIEDILWNLDSLVKNTIDKAPVRSKNFCLNRMNCPQLTHEEDKWERAMYTKWGPGGSGTYVPICERIQAYQFPLQASRNDRCWGKIDLLGIGPDFLPVPNELKKRRAGESPLRMLIEVAAYGFAIRKVWSALKADWTEAVHWFKGAPSLLPETLDKVTLVGVAPQEYWSACLRRLPESKAGAFPSEAWPPFWKLVDRLGTWFDIHFVSLEGRWDSDTESPEIEEARILDLRSESQIVS